MRLRRHPKQVDAPMPTLAGLVLRDGITTAVLKGASRERVADIQPHVFDSGDSEAIESLQRIARSSRWTDEQLRAAVLRRATPYPRCVICWQVEGHPLHKGCK